MTAEHRTGEHSDCRCAAADHVAPLPGARNAEGLRAPQDVEDDGPEGHRDPLPGHVVRVLHGGRPDGPADARRAGRARAAVPVQRAVQPAVHHARHDHAAAVRDADPVRVRQLHRAAADRVPRRGVPAVERLLLLAVPVRRPHRDVGLPHARRCGRFRLVRLHPALGRHPLAGLRRRPLDHGPRARRSRHHPRRGQLHHHDRLHARARHDDVPDADLHLDDLRHRLAGAASRSRSSPRRCSGC